jgi:hypothetical protein
MASRASLPDVLWQGLAPSVRRLLAVALGGGLVLSVAGGAWLATTRPVPLPALVLAMVGVGLVIQALGAGPSRLRDRRPLGPAAWYYGLSGVLMVLAMLEVGVGLIALTRGGLLRVVVLAGAAVTAFTAVFAALSTASLTRYAAEGGAGR